jgi:hypothetical protein
VESSALSGDASHQDLTAGILLICFEETKLNEPDTSIGAIEISWSDEKTPTVLSIRIRRCEYPQ